MTDNTALIDRFYSAFARRDHATMAACYSPSAEFSDPVFTDLKGGQVGAMWRMLCERGTDLRIEHGPVRCEGNRCMVDWQAWYTYSATGRPVHNQIAASFVIENGVIQRHRDVFDLYRWARQALGVTGVLLGWSPPVQKTIRTKAARTLESFMRKQRIAGAKV
jgi:ketosteroid isomerase-like protein